MQQRHRAITLHRFRLIPFRSPLLGESLLLSSPQGTEMFQFPWLSQPALCVQTGVTGHDPSRVSPFGNPRFNACLTANRGLSQPAASFIDSWCQGIHQWPLVAWIDTRIQDNICARYAVLKLPEGSPVPSRMLRGAVVTPSQLNNVPRSIESIGASYQLRARGPVIILTS